MSDLEELTKPLIVPMMDGIPTALTRTEQLTLAAWGVKTAMVIEGLNAKRTLFYDKQEREQLRLETRPPFRTSVWLAKYVGEFGAYGYAAELSGPINGTSDNIKSYVTTITAAQFVIQIAGTKLPDTIHHSVTITAAQRPGLWNQAAVRIYPPVLERANWPPTVPLNDFPGQSLEVFCDRWGPHPSS
jgi:hypothetical protein